MKTRLETTTLKSSDRFEFWQEIVCKNYVSASAVANHKDKNFNASLVKQQVGPLLVGELDAPTHFWTRTPRHVRNDEQEVYMVSLKGRGAAEIHQFGRTAKQDPGEIVLYDSRAPFNYNMDGKLTVVKIPKGLFEPRISKPRDLVAVRFSDASPLKPILTNLIAGAAAIDLSDRANDLIGHRLANSIIDILVSMSDLFRDTDPVGSATGQLEKIMRYARANLDNDELSPETLSAIGGISVRTLNRLFGAVGTTPMRWIWAQRLEASRIALTEKRVHSVTEAAFMCGFNELGHFSRSFKNAYGVTPRQALHQNEPLGGGAICLD